MAALATERDTPRMDAHINATPFSFPVKASTKCYQGGVAVINAGYAAPATVATGLVAVGVFQATADNSSGAAGAINAEVRPGIHKLGNSTAGDLIAQADVGKDCYLADDQTVAKTDATSTRSRAGKIVQVDSDGVWVLIGLGV